MVMEGSAQSLADEGRWVDIDLLLGSVEPGDLVPEEQELHAVALALTRRDDHAAAAMERAHNGWLEVGDPRRAARSAWWLGMYLMDLGHRAPALGWFQRGARIVEEAELDCMERSMFLLPRALGMLSGQPDEALELLREVVRASSRFDDPEQAALARFGMGLALVRIGDTTQGVAAFDEAMAAVLAGDTGPIASGLIYCGVILQCQQIFDLGRAREWTAALTEWCERQQGLLPFQFQCFVHRSEVAQVSGDWATAWREANAACDHLAGQDDPLIGMAYYQRAELRRLRGEFEEADRDYRRAAEVGHHAEPGHQLLLLASGEVEAADAAIRRARADAHRPVQRARVLAAFVEITLASGDPVSARDAVAELTELADTFASEQLSAVAAQCDAAVLLVEDEPAAALRAASRAEELWRRLRAPYETARVRVLRADACDRLGDAATAELERAAAVAMLESLGAAGDLVGLRDRSQGAPGGLSPREIEVIALVARGLSNRQIAEELVISERTVARHLSNIFTKIGVASRSAATAWAFQKGVVAP
jgi:DNA-binding NarL/FixJ family response regulator